MDTTWQRTFQPVFRHLVDWIRTGLDTLLYASPAEAAAAHNRLLRKGNPVPIGLVKAEGQPLPDGACGLEQQSTLRT